MLGLRVIPGTHPGELPAGPSGEAGRVAPPCETHSFPCDDGGVDGGGHSRPSEVRGLGLAGPPHLQTLRAHPRAYPSISVAAQDIKKLLELEGT